MPKKTYTQINSVTLAASSSSVSFDSTPQNFRDLVLIAQYTGTAAAENVTLRFNNDSGGNYSRIVMFGNSTSPTGSFAQANQMFSAIYGTNISIGTAHIMDYSATDKHKTTLVRVANTQQSEVAAQASRWASTSPITSISLIPVTGVFSSGSTFTLYGIEA